MKEVTLAPLAVDRYGGGVSRMQQPDSTHGVRKLLQYFAEWLPTPPGLNRLTRPAPREHNLSCLLGRPARSNEVQAGPTT
jgi:hypothetical protein